MRLCVSGIFWYRWTDRRERLQGGSKSNLLPDVKVEFLLVMILMWTFSIQWVCVGFQGIPGSPGLPGLIGREGPKVSAFINTVIQEELCRVRCNFPIDSSNGNQSKLFLMFQISMYGLYSLNGLCLDAELRYVQSNHIPVCSQGMMGDPGPKGLTQYADMTHTGTTHSVINTHWQSIKPGSSDQKMVHCGLQPHSGRLWRLTPLKCVFGAQLSTDG